MKGLQDKLISELKNGVANFGFKYSSSTRSFIKKAENVEFSYHLSFIVHGADFDVTADLAVRHDNVERLVKALTPPHPLLDGRERTWTIGVEVGNLTQGTQMRWSVATEQDVEVAVSGLIRIFQDVALPYFEQYSTPSSVYSMLLKDDKVAGLNSPLRVKRWTRIVTLASLLEPEKLAHWVSKGLETLEEAGDRQLDEFKQIAEALLARQPA
ncbi:hypothetical protein N185_15980 [Sinorhizobium sp. GW3]|nr:hypothetical protein N185_15980 [Sinorhizobium sp. GW3]